MREWKTYKLEELITLQRGHDLTRTQMQHGKYPVAGSNGVIGFHNEFTTKGPSVTIGRSGNIGNAYYYDVNFWAHNTTLYVKQFKNCDPKFIYYLLQTMNFGGHNSGSAVPSLNRNYIHPIEVKVPDLPIQRQIATILSSLDDKIELNLQMNQTLEAMAQAIFKEWFVHFNFPGFDGELVDGLPKGWKVEKLANICTVKYGKDHKHLDDGNIPVYGSGGIMRYAEKALYAKESILIPRKGTLTNLFYVTEPFWSVDTMFYTVINEIRIRKYLFYLLKTSDSRFKKSYHLKLF